MELKDQIIVIASTDRPDILDYALLKPYRTSYFFHISLPDKQARVQILINELKMQKINEDVYLEFLADLTEDFSGSDLHNLCQNVIRHAVSVAG